MKNFQITPLADEELVAINGGGLVEDIGYAAHAVQDAVCSTYKSVKDTVSGWFN